MSYLDKTGCEHLVDKTKNYIFENTPMMRTFVGRLIADTSIGTEASPKVISFYTGDSGKRAHVNNAEKYFDVDDDGFIYLKKAPTGRMGSPVLINFQLYLSKGYTAGKFLYVHLLTKYGSGGGHTRIPRIKYRYYLPIANPYIVVNGTFYYYLETGHGISLDVYSSDGKGALGTGDGFDTYLALTTVI